MENRQTTDYKETDKGEVTTQPQENVDQAAQPAPPSEKATEEKTQTRTQAIAQNVMDKVKEIDDRILKINERIQKIHQSAKYAEDLRDRLIEAKTPTANMLKDLPGPESHQEGSEVLLIVRLCSFMSNTLAIRVEADQFLGK
ncbi:hypothetical protein BHE90_012904 [Fusarium euwallaceae]|uniref:Uncharacterized protein n=1 Tax=Fusarium euwallaceae TaxID=1147111 RepID=A0A430LAI6_9HYPO|nr:hypothetical protein BHE90_012904 [Fusarium euwallaceae]